MHLKFRSMSGDDMSGKLQPNKRLLTDLCLRCWSKRAVLLRGGIIPARPSAHWSRPMGLNAAVESRQLEICLINRKKYDFPHAICSHQWCGTLRFDPEADCGEIKLHGSQHAALSCLSHLPAHRERVCICVCVKSLGISPSSRRPFKCMRQHHTILAGAGGGGERREWTIRIKKYTRLSVPCYMHWSSLPSVCCLSDDYLSSDK